MISKYGLMYMEKLKYSSAGDTMVSIFNANYSLKDDDILLSVGGVEFVIDLPNKNLRRLLLKAEDRWKSYIEVYERNRPFHKRIFDYAA